MRQKGIPLDEPKRALRIRFRNNKTDGSGPGGKTHLWPDIDLERLNDYNFFNLRLLQTEISSNSDFFNLILLRVLQSEISSKSGFFKLISPPIGISSVSEFFKLIYPPIGIYSNSDFFKPGFLRRGVPSN